MGSDIRTSDEEMERYYRERRQRLEAQMDTALGRPTYWPSPEAHEKWEKAWDPSIGKFRVRRVLDSSDVKAAQDEMNVYPATPEQDAAPPEGALNVLTSDQREERRKYICASDIAPIMGLHPTRSASDVYAEKVYGLKEEGDDPNEAIVTGQLLEPAILDWAERELGSKLERNLMIVHSGGQIAANLDGMTPRREPVEAKTAGLLAPDPKMGEWGPDGSDEVPMCYLLQVQTQLLVTGAARGYLAALLGGRGWAMYCIEANADVHAMIVKAAGDFYANHVLPRKPPKPGASPPISLETAKKIIRPKGKEGPIRPATVERFLAAKDDEAVATMARKLAERVLKDELKDNEIGTYPGGRVCFDEHSRKGYTVKPTTFRALRIVPDKAEEPTDVQ